MSFIYDWMIIFCFRDYYGVGFVCSYASVCVCAFIYLWLYVYIYIYIYIYIYSSVQKMIAFFPYTLAERVSRCLSCIRVMNVYIPCVTYKCTYTCQQLQCAIWLYRRQLRQGHWIVCAILRQSCDATYHQWTASTAVRQILHKCSVLQPGLRRHWPLRRSYNALFGRCFWQPNHQYTTEY